MATPTTPDNSNPPQASYEIRDPSTGLLLSHGNADVLDPKEAKKETLTRGNPKRVGPIDPADNQPQLTPELN